MIVVDTHAVLWLTQDRTLLSTDASAALAEARRAGQLAIAAITLYELAFMAAKGRVTVSEPLDMYLRFVESLFKVFPVNGQIALQATRFKAAYPKDPADRLIGATAVVYGAALVTKDAMIRGSNEVKCIW